MEEKSRSAFNKKIDEAAKKASTGDITRIQLEKGENIVRIVDADFRENFVLFVDDTEGNKRRISMGQDPAANREKYGIVFDNTDDRPSHRYYFRALEGAVEKIDGKNKIVLDNQIKLFEIGPMLFKQIAAIQLDDEYDDIDEINMKIKKTGEGRNTEYQVLPGNKKSALPDDLIDDCDLDEISAETPLATAYEIFGEEYDGGSTEEDDFKEEKKSDKKADAKVKAKEKAKVAEEEKKKKDEIAYKKKKDDAAKKKAAEKKAAEAESEEDEFGGDTEEKTDEDEKTEEAKDKTDGGGDDLDDLTIEDLED